MKALVLEGPHELNLRDIDVPKPGVEDALIKVEAIGVCRSDHHFWEWGPDSGMMNFDGPKVMGHEISGTVVETGKDVTNFKVGDRVVIPFSGSDGTCKYCNSGQPHLCENSYIPGVSYVGGYAEYVCVPKANRNLAHLPEDLSFLNGAALGCRFITAFHGLVDRAAITIGENVVVFGCGGVGLSAINIAKAAGANVIAVDINPENLKLAKVMGADTTINGKEVDAVEEVQKLTSSGADLAVDALGLELTVNNCIASLRKGGRLLQIGITTKNGGNVSVPMTSVVMREISVIGTLGMPPFRYDSIWPMLSAGKLDPSKMVTGEININQVNDVFKEMSNNTVKGTNVVTSF